MNDTNDNQLKQLEETWTKEINEKLKETEKLDTASDASKNQEGVKNKTDIISERRETARDFYLSQVSIHDTRTEEEIDRSIKEKLEGINFNKKVEVVMLEKGDRVQLQEQSKINEEIPSESYFCAVDSDGMKPGISDDNYEVTRDVAVLKSTSTDVDGGETQYRTPEKDAFNRILDSDRSTKAEESGASNDVTSEISSRRGLDETANEPTVVTREEIARTKAEVQASTEPGSHYDREIDSVIKHIDERNLTESEAKEELERIGDNQQATKIEYGKNGSKEWKFETEGTALAELNEDVYSILEEQGRSEKEIESIAKSGIDHHPVTLKEGDRIYGFVPEGGTKGPENAFWVNESTFIYIKERYTLGQENGKGDALALPAQFNWDDVTVVTVTADHTAVESTIAPSKEWLGNRSLESFGGLQQVTPDPEKLTESENIVSSRQFDTDRLSKDAENRIDAHEFGEVLKDDPAKSELLNGTADIQSDKESLDTPHRVIPTEAPENIQMSMQSEVLDEKILKDSNESPNPNDYEAMAKRALGISEKPEFIESFGSIHGDFEEAKKIAMGLEMKARGDSARFIEGVIDAKGAIDALGVIGAVSAISKDSEAHPSGENYEKWFKQENGEFPYTETREEQPEIETKEEREIRLEVREQRLEEIRRSEEMQRQEKLGNLGRKY